MMADIFVRNEKFVVRSLSDGKELEAFNSLDLAISFAKKQSYTIISIMDGKLNLLSDEELWEVNLFEYDAFISEVYSCSDCDLLLDVNDVCEYHENIETKVTPKGKKLQSKFTGYRNKMMPTEFMPSALKPLTYLEFSNKLNDDVLVTKHKDVRRGNVPTIFMSNIFIIIGVLTVLIFLSIMVFLGYVWYIK